MGTYYLVDYENVNANGLKGCEKLGEADFIYIFFTKNAKSLDMSILSDHGKARIEMIEVPSGKQSVDMHIGAYLGYLVGTNDKKSTYTIISKDSDYDKVIEFFKSKFSIKAARKTQIKDGADTKKAEKQKAADKKDTKDTDKLKQKLYQEVLQVLRTAGVKKADAKSTAEAVKKLYGKKQFLAESHNALIKAGNSNDIYTKLKPVLSKYV